MITNNLSLATNSSIHPSFVKNNNISEKTAEIIKLEAALITTLAQLEKLLSEGKLEEAKLLEPLVEETWSLLNQLDPNTTQEKDFSEFQALIGSNKTEDLESFISVYIKEGGIGTKPISTPAHPSG